MPIPLSNDRRELMRKIAHDGMRVLVLKSKLSRLPDGVARAAVLQELGPLEKKQSDRLLRITGVAHGV